MKPTDYTIDGYLPVTIEGNANFIPSNIKKDVYIWGLRGTLDTSGGDLLSTTSLGTLTTTNTSSTSTNKTVTVTGIYNYDMLIVKTYASPQSTTNGVHIATVKAIFLTGSTSITTPNSSSIASATLNLKRGTGANVSNSNTTAYGIFPNSCTVTSANNGTATMPMYMRYNSTYSGTINSIYITKVYGIKLFRSF